MRLAGWSYSYDKMPIEESIAHMASVGFDGMELATGPQFSTPIEALDDARVDQIKSLLDHHRLEPVAVSSLWGLVAPTDESWRDAEAKWRRAIDVAARLGAGFVAGCSGGAPEGWAWHQTWDAMLANTHRLAEMAGERGVTIVIEPHWGHAVERPGDIIELIDAVGLPTLKVNLDVCHTYALGYSLEAAAAILAPRTAYAHVCDVRGRHPGGPPPAGHQLVNPGEGEIDFAKWFRLLHDHGHQGWVATQISAMRRVWPGYDPKLAMEQVYGVLTDAMERAGVPRLRR